MSRNPTVLGLVLIVAALLTTGCESVNAMLQGLDKPTARVTGTRLANLSLQDATLLFDVEISNPYSVPLPLADLSYALASGGQEFLTGQSPLSGSVPAGGKRTVALEAKVPFAQALKVLQSVKPGAVVPYEANMALSVTPPVGEALSLPLKKSGELPIPAAPQVELTSLKWQDIGLERVTGVMRLSVRNTNQFPVDLSKLQYSLNLAGTRVADGGVTQPVAFKPGGDATIDVPLSFSPSRVGLALLNIVRGSGADYRIEGLLSAGTPFGPLELPYQRAGKTSFAR